MHDCPTQSVSFGYSQDNASPPPKITQLNENYYIFLEAKWRFAWMMSLINTWIKLHTSVTGDLHQHWHMRITITSSKCVLQQRHLLGYKSRTQTLTLTLELTLTLTLFLTLTWTVFFERKQKRHRNIGQYIVIFTRDGGGFIRGP